VFCMQRATKRNAFGVASLEIETILPYLKAVIALNDNFAVSAHVRLY
jgi:hypothetical protein